MFPKWIYFVVAALIACVAFVVGQLFPGMGVPFVALISTTWVAYSVFLQRKLHYRNG